ncbi:ParB N-terminal domain-containing protein, partial [Enterococcus hirae]
MSEVIGKIFVTKDYAKFKKLKGNRQIKKNQNLEESIKNSGIMIPIEVNEHFEILDGQNRFELAKKWNQLIPYRILDGSGIQEVIELNSTTKSWTLIDYIN